MLIAASFCAETANGWQLVGTFLSWFKIVIPILLIIMCVLDLTKAVISSKVKISDSLKRIVARVIAALAIFFLPQIITLVFSLVKNASPWQTCKECVINPNGNICTDLIVVEK